MAHFFNFNLDNPEVINAQIDVLEKKFREWKNYSDGLQAERKVRAYIMEAVSGFYNPHVKGAKAYVASHPACDVLTGMLNWLKDHGYEIKIQTDAGIVITSSRNTFVESAFYEVDNKWPECIGLMNVIMSTRNRQLLGD